MSLEFCATGQKCGPAMIQSLDGKKGVSELLELDHFIEIGPSPHRAKELPIKGENHNLEQFLSERRLDLVPGPKL